MLTKDSLNSSPRNIPSPQSVLCETSNRSSRIPYVVLGLACFFYWVSLPPWKQPWAAYISAFFFAGMVYMPQPFDRKDFFRFWLVSSVLWLMLLQGVRLAFWPLYAGWVALSLYVAVYIPAFIGSARALRTRFFVPFPFACAIAWTGLELFRAYFITGFSACMLGHSQTPWPSMIQIAAQFGAYGVSFLIMLFGATVCYIVSWVLERKCTNKPSRSWGELAGSLVAIGVLVVWMSSSVGSLQKYDELLKSQKSTKPLGRFLMVQENMKTLFDVSLEDLKIGWQDYARRTTQELLIQGNQKLDVVLWPEGTFGIGSNWLEWDGSPPPAFLNETEDGIRESQQFYRDEIAMKVAYLTRGLSYKPTLIVGAGMQKLNQSGIQINNAAFLIEADASEPSYYGKRHLVMFGEYIPFLSNFPNLLRLIGMPTTSPGDKFVSWRLKTGAVVAPSICFEDVVPHFIQRQVSELRDMGQSPDVLINLTNDGWFRGSSILDHHLNNAIFAAVENRRPLLVSANSGITAWIDGSGRLVQSLDRFQTGAIIAEPIMDGRDGLWQRIGDWPAKILCIIALFPLLAWTLQRIRVGRALHNS